MKVYYLSIFKKSILIMFHMSKLVMNYQYKLKIQKDVDKIGSSSNFIFYSCGEKNWVIGRRAVKWLNY